MFSLCLTERSFYSYHSTGLTSLALLVLRPSDFDWNLYHSLSSFLGQDIVKCCLSWSLLPIQESDPFTHQVLAALGG